MEHVQQAIPVLASSKIEKTVDLYKEKLGVDKIGWMDEHYAVMGRDKIHPENTSCYMHVTAVGVLYTEIRQAGVVHPNGPLKTQPWGMREFAILDEDGNMIKFGKRI